MLNSEFLQHGGEVGMKYHPKPRSHLQLMGAGEGELVLFKGVVLGLSITLQSGPHAQVNNIGTFFLERERLWS